MRNGNAETFCRSLTSIREAIKLRRLSAKVPGLFGMHALQLITSCILRELSQLVRLVNPIDSGNYRLFDVHWSYRFQQAKSLQR
jgi:hypothetical protein